MATINTIITEIPEAGHRGVDARSLFVSKQEAFQDALTGGFVPQVNSWRTEANLVRSEVNSLRDATATDKNTATTQAGIATTKANEASVSASQALTSKNAIQGYVIPGGASYSVDSINTQNSAMTKAQFNALAEERKANRAGSGFDSFGKGSSTTSVNVNEGIWTDATQPNRFYIGKTTANSGTSITNHAESIINGVLQKFKNINNSTLAIADILLPTAPTIYPYDIVLTTEQINSGVIKHADASNSGLIVNGKFDTDTSGWTANGATLSVNANKLRITVATTNGASVQSIATVIGKKYIVELVYTQGTNSTASIQMGNTNALGTSIISLSNISGRFTAEFTATATATFIGAKVDGTGLYAEFDNIAVYPADAISRSDLVFLESFHEDISEKNFVYPLGNVQYLGGNTDGLTGVTNGSFTGFETYSSFGSWQTPSSLIGKGYVWSNLTEAQRKAFIANPENNCYLDGDKTIQVRYRVRVMLGEDTNSMSKATVQGKATVPSTVLFTAPTTTVDAGLYSNTSTTYTYTGTTTGAISIATISRRNQGMWHHVYNPNGTKLASDGLDSYRTAVSFTSISDCFDTAKLLTASGYIGSVSGRPNTLFYDQVHESDITDLRNSSKKVEDYSRLISREFNKLVAGTTRGKEGEQEVRPYSSQDLDGTLTTVLYANGFPSTVKVGDIVTIIGISSGGVIRTYKDIVTDVGASKITLKNVVTRSNGTYLLASSSTRTKSNTLLHCDIIGNPANYPSSWKQSGVFGTPLIVAEDGTSLLPDGAKDTFKLSRKANATPLLCLRSTDSGATWVEHKMATGLGQTSRNWYGMTTLGTDVYACVVNGDIYKQTGGVGNFVALGQTSRNWMGMTTLGTDVYACVYAGDIYKLPKDNFGFNSINNSITINPLISTDSLSQVYYQTKTSMAVPVANSEVVEYGKVIGTNGLSNAHLVSTLIGKVSTANTAPYLQMGYDISAYRIDTSTIKWSTTSTEIPVHSALSLGGGASGVATVKVLPYLTRLNGKAYLNLIFKEMKHNGTSWGDDNKFNIVDNVSTTTDNNAQTVLIGQKTVELPYFIGADE